MKKKIILASTSPRRHFLAEKMGLDFDIVPSDYEEDMTMKVGPGRMVKVLALGKAEDVARRYKSGIVIGVDTIVVFKGKKMGKPKSKKEAVETLKSLSGKSNKVYTGMAMIDCETGKRILSYDVSKVKIRKISDYEIKKYVATGEPMDKAGSYAVQELGSIFIKSVKGCYPNIMGLPIPRLNKNLKKMGVNIFDYSQWKRK
jgi:septum formation protein